MPHDSRITRRNACLNELPDLIGRLAGVGLRMAPPLTQLADDAVASIGKRLDDPVVFVEPMRGMWFIQAVRLEPRTVQEHHVLPPGPAPLGTLGGEPRSGAC